jgi:hypothetical protein
MSSHADALAHAFLRRLYVNPALIILRSGSAMEPDYVPTSKVCIPI